MVTQVKDEKEDDYYFIMIYVITLYIFEKVGKIK